MTKITKRGGHVLEDDYPTHYLPNVGRQVMADGGEVYNALRLAREVGGPAQEGPRAPYGVVDLGDKIIVGSPHGEKIDLSDDLKKRVQDVAAKHGAWYEGTGGDIKPNKNLIKYYRGSWDDLHAESVKGYPIEYLGGMFSNVDVNKPHEKFEDPKRSIMESLIANQEKMKYFKDRRYDEKVLRDFLRQGSQDDVDFESMAQMPATQENLRKFFTTGERLTWPDNWQEYPNKLGKIAKKIEDQRNQFLLNAPPGVYVTGAGHIPELQGLRKDLPVIGGERAGFAKGGIVAKATKVGRQVMADGGVPSINQIRQMLVGTAPAPSGPTPRAYTDPYGLKVAAPFVESMRGGYPTPPSMATTAPAEHSSSSLADLIGSIFGRRRSGYDQGGPVVEGDVSFLEDEPSSLPTFAQPQVQEVTQALDAAREVNQPKKEYEPFNVLPLKETEQGIEFDPYAGIMGSVTRPAKYFYETMSGQKEMEPTSDEAIRAATDIAGTLTMGSGAFERPAGALAAGASRPGMGHNMPPEAIVPERVTNPLGMHSEAAEVARNLPQQRGTIEQMLAMMKQKVNPEELHWSGVAEAFQPGQKVTAEELASHFESKLPQIQETMYGGSGHEFKYGNQNWTHEQWRNAITRAERNRNFDLAEAIMNEWEASEGLGVGSKAPMYPGYVTPGGSNYREIVLHHPVQQVEDSKGGRLITYKVAEDSEPIKILAFPDQIQKMQEKGFIVDDLGPATMDAPKFTESHYDEPNVLGHLRMSDMEGPGGEKILNVHEFQSDWGQQARKKGVVTGKEAEDKAALVEKQRGMQSIITDFVKDIKQKASGAYKSAGMDDVTVEQLVDRSSPASLAQFVGGDELMNKYVRLIEENAKLYEDIKNIDSRKPAAPYVTSREGQHNTPGWTDLLIKRVLQEAERGGYDKVVWDTPAEQAQRYMNQPQIVKGMQGYYGDLLPRRHKKVAPEIKIGEHEVGKPGSPIKGEEVADWLAKYVGPSSDYNKYKSAVERMPDAGPEQWLKASGLYDDYVIIKATEMGHEDPLNGLEVTNFGGKWNLHDRDVAKGVFDSKKEAYAAKKTLAGEKATQLLNQSTVKRPGFEMTPELKERIRRGLSAYRYGGEVEDALNVARSLR